MFTENESLLQTLTKIQKYELLEKLIQQLNKDLSLSGIHFQFDPNMDPQFLKHQLSEIVLILMKNDVQKFHNFLYRIDISENTYLSIKEENDNKKSQIIMILILKKEWQKVWFKSKNLQ